MPDSPEGVGHSQFVAKDPNPRRDHIVDIPLTDRPDGKVDVERGLRELNERGIKLHPDTVSGIRLKRKSGLRTEHSIHTVDRLQETAALKDALFLGIARQGVKGREFQQARGRNHLFSSDGFTEGLASQLGIEHKQLQKFLRAMRADMVYSERENPTQGFVALFTDTARDFLDAKTSVAPSLVPKSIRQIQERWEGTSIEEFYQLLYELSASTTTIGTWTPYEVEPLVDFYRNRFAIGSPFTQFDRLVLQTEGSEVRSEDVIDEVRSSTGIKIDRMVLEEHKNALVYGKPTIPKPQV